MPRMPAPPKPDQEAEPARPREQAPSDDPASASGPQSLLDQRTRKGLRPGQLDPDVGGELAHRMRELTGRRSYLRNFWYAAGGGSTDSRLYQWTEVCGCDACAVCAESSSAKLFEAFVDKSLIKTLHAVKILIYQDVDCADLQRSLITSILMLLWSHLSWLRWSEGTRGTRGVESCAGNA